MIAQAASRTSMIYEQKRAQAVTQNIDAAGVPGEEAGWDADFTSDGEGSDLTSTESSTLGDDTISDEP